MKQQENNEIDSLLRVLAGHEQSAPSDLGGNATGAHLDADELSSYAERALPPSTRARYTAHLVDCDDCRRIVAQLSLAAGAPTLEPPRVDRSPASSWRRTLAALFAPAVLRYAMPAVLLVFVGLAFFAWRQQRGESLIARNSQTEVTKPADLDNGAGTTPSSPIDNLATKQQKAAPSTSTRASTTTDKAGEQQQKNADAPAATSSATSTEKEAAKKEGATVAQPAYAPEPPPPPAPKPANSVTAKDSSRTVSEEVEVKEATARKREADRSSADASAGAPATAKAPAANKDDEGRKAKTLSVAGAAEDRRDEAAETRAVAGRRFQRRNNVWVDTAFNSSLSITSVTRGSEQFRALIADEPEIGTIAKQLSGEVVIVWKGRAYRIR
jgi:hypothetical protein